MTREQKLEAALREFLEITEPASRLRPPDPDYGAEVRALGDRIGYGALMASAQASWRQANAAFGHEGGKIWRPRPELNRGTRICRTWTLFLCGSNIYLFCACPEIVPNFVRSVSRLTTFAGFLIAA